MTVSKTRIAGLLLLCFCLFYAYLIGHIRLLPFQLQDAFTARTMPTVLVVLGIVMSLILVVRPKDDEALSLKGLEWKTTLAFLALMSLYGFLLKPLGFIIATSAFLMVGFFLLGERRPIILFFVSVPIVVAFWVLMTMGLDVYIDPAPSFL